MKTKFLILSIFAVYLCNAQKISGIAEYTSKTGSDEFRKTVLENPEMDPEMKKFLKSKMENVLTKKYTLFFTEKQSKYTESQSVKIETQETDMSWSPYGIDISIYKDYTNNKIILEKDLMGKTFFVENSLPDYNWELVKESKKIGKFTCYKATSVIPVSEEAKAAYEKELKEYNNRATQFIKPEEPKPITLTAWYTIDIPVINGPANYGGLPGLILEINDGDSTIICTSISFEKKEKNKINLPDEKKIISEAKFEEISKKKTQEIKDRYN